MGPSVCLSPGSSYQHTREEPVPAGTRCGPVPTVPPGSVPAAVARGWGGARCGSAHPVSSVTHVASKFPSEEVEEGEKDKNIPAPDNIPRGAIGGEFVPARARGASGRCWGARGPAGLRILGWSRWSILCVCLPSTQILLAPSLGRAQLGLWKAPLGAFLRWGPQLLSPCPPCSHPASLMVGWDVLFPL